MMMMMMMMASMRALGRRTAMSLRGGSTHAGAVPQKLRALRRAGGARRSASVPVAGGERTRGGGEDGWAMKLLYDGECPLCVKEVNMLRRRDRAFNSDSADANVNDNGGKIKFVDIAAASYDPRENADISFETAMGQIHAIERAEGDEERVITGVRVFRRAYECVGLGWVYAITKIPVVNSVANAVYKVWADRRLELTGRGSMEDVLSERRKRASENMRENDGNEDDVNIFVDDEVETCDIQTGRCGTGGG